MLTKSVLLSAVGLMLLAVPVMAAEKGKSTSAELRTVSLVCDMGGCKGDGPFCCRSDEAKLQEAIQAVPGVKKVSLERKTKAVTLRYEPGKLDLKALVAAAEKAGYGSPKL